MSEDMLYDLLPAAVPPALYHGWKAHPSFGDAAAELEAALGPGACVDHSMFGRIEVSGKDRLDLLHRLSTNALAGLSPHRAAATVFVTDKGRIIDRVLVCALDGSLLLLTSPGAEAFLVQWIGKYTITEDIRLNVVTATTVMASLIGPETISSFCAATGCAAPLPGEITRGGEEGAFTVVRDPGGEFAHVVVPSSRGAALIGAINASRPGARWIGWLPYEAYRITRGIPARPGELNGDHNPLECGLRSAVSFTKGCYIGQEVIARLDTYGKERHALASLALGRPLPGTLPLTLTRGDIPAGVLTSVSGVPHRGIYGALGIVRRDAVRPGETLVAGEEGATARLTGFPGGEGRP
ncbi:MAG TPA: hypothetical protein VL221_00595 [Bacteroidota bacterium]|nr:hypothetical protein [Bacteroidota bacterium]